MFKNLWILAVIVLTALTITSCDKESEKSGERVASTGETPENDSSSEDLNQYIPTGWNPDFLDALDQAQREDKYLLLNFTGSDWCVWCERLRDEVFFTEEFKAWSAENAVLVFLDFPSGIELSEAQIQQNGILQQFLGVQGYPAIWLIDNDLTPKLVTGYQEGGAAEYIRHLEEDSNIDVTKVNDFKNALSEVIGTYLEPLEL